MNTFWYDLWEAVVVNRYVKSGLYVGDAASYAGSPGLYWELNFKIWERAYIKLGYVPLSCSDWQFAGGYGAPYVHLLRTYPKVLDNPNINW